MSNISPSPLIPQSLDLINMQLPRVTSACDGLADAERCCVWVKNVYVIIYQINPQSTRPVAMLLQGAWDMQQCNTTPNKSSCAKCFAFVCRDRLGDNYLCHHMRL